MFSFVAFLLVLYIQFFISAMGDKQRIKPTHSKLNGTNFVVDMVLHIVPAIF